MIIQYLQPRPRWRGFSFALHPDTVQGFLLPGCNTAPYKRLQRALPCQCKLYRLRHETAHRSLQRRFLRLYPLNRLLYQPDTSDYNTTCDTLERLPASGRPQPIPDTTATRDAVQVSTAAYYNKVYKRVQHIADHASPAGSRCFPRPAACSLAPGQRSGRTGSARHTPPGGAVQRQGQRRAARNHWRLPPHLFSVCRPIANRGQQ